MKASLMIDYVLLDEPERKLFAESKHEYLIEQFQYSKFTTSKLSRTAQIKYNFKNPTKMMIWVAQFKKYLDKKQYYNYTIDDFYLEIEKYIDKDETDNKYLREMERLQKHFINSLLQRNKNSNTFSKMDILKMPYENHNISTRLKLQQAVSPSSRPIILNSELKVNGHARFKTSAAENSLLRPYTYYNASHNTGVNVYNFGLYPVQNQPSGSINFSFLNDINLLLNFNDFKDEEVIIKTITVSYNLLRIMSGYGGLAFDII
jgi:hypothetical protein